jgi:hypothetical protein
MTACRDGAIAQLGERLNGIQEVGGSTPPGSTKSGSIASHSRHPAPSDVGGAKVVRSKAASIAGGQWIDLPN